MNLVSILKTKVIIKKVKKYINVLPCTYSSVKFRSRLEARWAYYFDLIGLNWLYEFEGFSLPSGNYVPDFYCYANGGDPFFVEIKPNLFFTNDILIEELSKETGLFVSRVIGPPSLKPHFGLCYNENRPIYFDAIFCHYAFSKKKWDLPYLSDSTCWDEPYWKEASNLRFENGLALVPKDAFCVPN